MAKKILIADDSEAFRKLEDTLLKPYGFTLLHASNGIEAMKVALGEKPDLILLDIQMPVMDGAQVLAFLKKEPTTAGIPIIVITTLGRPEDRALLTSAGAYHLLGKPIQGTELIRTVRAALGQT
jgi:CheY-like chemotaxis protein